MADILEYVDEIRPIETMLTECSLDVTEAPPPLSPDSPFKLKLEARVVQKGTIYTEDEYYFSLSESTILDVINEYVTSNLGFQGDFNDLGERYSSVSTKYCSVEWRNDRLYVKILDDASFHSSPNITLYNGSFYFDIKIEAYADPYYQGVTYVGVKGDVVGGVSASINNPITLPLTTVVNPGYISDGWYTSATGGEKVGDAGAISNYFSLTGYDYTESINRDFYIYEQQSEIPKYVTYNANGGTVVPSYASSVGGAAVILPLPQREDHDFYGWYTAKDGGTKIGNAGDTYVPAVNITLYARWKERHPVYVHDLIIEGSVYQGAYIHTGDTNITGLPATPSRENYTLKGYSLSSSEGDLLADARGILYPNISNYTGSSGQYLLDAPLSLYAIWSRDEYVITFDANGGENSQFKSIRTLNGKIVAFPSVLRASYKLRGWAERKDVEDLNSEKYVSTDTLFSKNTTLYAIWEEVPVNSDVTCYLERVLGDTRQRMYFPIVSSIEDNVSVSLIEMDTIMFGYENRFVTDMGTKQTFTVTIERVNPSLFNDNDTVVENFSNSKWWSTFLNYINFWQNDGKSTNNERTGGFKFVYMPTNEGDRRNLYPVIEKNVFISGQVSVDMRPDHMKITLPLAVATMDISASVPRWVAKFEYGKDSKEFFEVETIVGLDMTFPSPENEWVTKKFSEEFSKFTYWVSKKDGSTYSAGDILTYNPSFREDPPTFYATWNVTQYIRIYYIAERDSTTEKYRQFTYAPGKSAIVSAYLYGGGGTGGIGSMSRRPGAFVDQNAPAGGGGGAPKMKYESNIRLNASNFLKIELGYGGLVFDVPSSYEGPYLRDGKPSTISINGESSLIFISGTGAFAKESAGGVYNGGRGGDAEEYGARGEGSFGGSPGAPYRYTRPGFLNQIQYYYGGGGGGGSIQQVNGVEFTCGGKTYRSAYTFSEGKVYLNDNTAPFNFSEGKNMLHIISQGGKGATGIDGARDEYDAPFGYRTLGTDSKGVTHYAIFAAAGGGGRNYGEENTSFSRGSDGFVILAIDES